MADGIFKIIEMYNLKDGRTVFSGTMDEYNYYVHECTCRLIVNGSLRQELTLEGEMIAGASYKNPDNIRSVSSPPSEKVVLDEDEVHTKDCYLLIPAFIPKTSDDSTPKYKKYLGKNKE